MRLSQIDRRLDGGFDDALLFRRQLFQREGTLIVAISGMRVCIS